jgi:type IV pilus assembly protein PilM
MVELVFEGGNTFRMTRGVIRYSSFDWDVFEEKRAQTLSEFVRKAREDHKLGKGRLVHISMPSNSVFIRYVDLLVGERKKIADVIKLEAQQQIPMPLDEVSWDYKIVAEKSRREKQAVLMAVKRDVVDESTDIIKKAGFVSRSITLSLLCLLNIAKRSKESRNAEGIIIVDIGAESSGILINRKKHVWLRSFSLGGSQISKSIAENADIDFAKAEQIKREGPSVLGNMDPAIIAQVHETISQNLENFVSEVERSISFYKMDQLNNDSSLDQGFFKKFRLLLTGGGSKIEGLEDFFKSRLGMDVSYMRTFENIKISKKALDVKQLDGINRESDIREEVDPLFAVAVGAALEGFEKDGTGINFLKQDLAVQKKFNIGQFLRVASYIFFFSAFVIHFFFQNEEISIYKQHLLELQRVKDNIETNGPLLTNIRKDTQILNENGSFLMGYLKKRVLWLSALNEIAQALPNDVWLTNYQGASTYTSATENRLILQGITTSYDDLNAFIAALRESSLVYEVKPESVVSQNDLFNFLLNVKINDEYSPTQEGQNANSNT